jgi:hypothetical protein
MSSRMALANNVGVCTCSFKRFFRRSHLNQIAIKQINNDKWPKDSRSFYGYFDFSIQRNFWMKYLATCYTFVICTVKYTHTHTCALGTGFKLVYINIIDPIHHEHVFVNLYGILMNFLNVCKFFILFWRMVIIPKCTKLCLIILGFNFLYHKL